MAYQDAVSALSKEHGLVGVREGWVLGGFGPGTNRLGTRPNCNGCVRGVVLSERSDFLREPTKHVCKRRGFWKEVPPTHALLRSEKIGTKIPSLFCTECYC